MNWHPHRLRTTHTFPATGMVGLTRLRQHPALPYPPRPPLLPIAEVPRHRLLQNHHLLNL